MWGFQERLDVKVTLTYLNEVTSSTIVQSRKSAGQDKEARYLRVMIMYLHHEETGRRPR